MHAPGPTDDGTWLCLAGASLRLGGRLFLREIDWTARVGEQWALLGANGAGKTVLAELALGQRHPAGGSAWLDPSIDVQRDIGWVSFEAQRRLCEDDARHDISDYLENAVDSGTTVGALLATCGSGEQRERVVGQLGIGALLERGIRFLSSGEARRTLLARLLLQQPRVAVLDNPFEGIDVASREAIARAIDELLGSATRVLLLTRREAEIPCGITHVLALEDGRVRERGERVQVLGNAARATGAAAADGTALPIAASAAPPAGEEPLLDLRAVSARYGEQLVLDRVDLRLGRGEHLCIAGPNGCGKSTLLALICGDNPRAFGQQVRVLGRLRGDGEPVWELKRHFGIVGNALHLGYPPRTRVIDVLLSGFHDTLGLYEECGARERGSARAWLAALGLAAQAGARFGALSFGEQRMLLIARAVVKAPPLLILDEPCSGLDGPNRERALALIDRIAAAGRTQILCVSHEAEEMPRCITRRLEFRREGNEGPYALVEV